MKMYFAVSGRMAFSDSLNRAMKLTNSKSLDVLISFAALNGKDLTGKGKSYNRCLEILKKEVK